MSNSIFMNLNTPEKSQILQHNKILLGGQNINLRAKQLIYVLAHELPREDPLALVSIDAKDFLEFINSKSKEKWSDIYSLTKDIRRHLNDNPILIKKDKGKDYTEINWISRLGVEDGHIIGRFSPDIGYYLAYKKGEPYTKLLWDLRNYKSAHTARIIDLFQKYHKKESGDLEIKFSYSVDELKFFLGVQNKYQKFSDFKRRVLEPARKELERNDYVPYWFEYEITRRGRKASKVKFTVYVRHKVLLDLIPELKLLETKTSEQTNIFEAAIISKLSETQNKIITTLIELGIKKNYATKVISNLSETQSIAYLELIRYGVNRTLAFTIIKEYCSFGELIDYEHLYVKHSLEIVEKNRLKRIEDFKAGKSTKKITPEDKRGGLAKKVFFEKQNFPSFMEKLSSIRNKQNNHKKTEPSRMKQATSIADIIDNMKKNY